MLDNVLEYFIDNAPDTIKRAKFSAMKERSIGLGTLGYHYLLQRKGLLWESEDALYFNRELFREIKYKAQVQSMVLAEKRGEPDDLKGTGMRNAHLMAIAPNASSGLIVGSSPSIEPNAGNAYTHKTRAGSVLIKNPYLENLLQGMGYNTDEVWSDIIINEGSVQHLDFLSTYYKDLYKTAFELDQGWVVKHAAIRQPSICQGQSVNLFFPSGSKKSYIKDVHLEAWRDNLKGLYYFRTQSRGKAEKVSEKVESNKLTEEKRNIIYGRKNCVNCDAAKKVLGAKGIEYEYIDIEELGKSAAEITGRMDVRSVPQIYIQGDYVGGLEDLFKYLIQTPVETDNECIACEG